MRFDLGRCPSTSLSDSRARRNDMGAGDGLVQLSRMTCSTAWMPGFSRIAAGTSAALLVCVLRLPSAQAATMQKVNQTDWQGGVSGLPSYVNMYEYVPGTLAAKPPIVVAPHHCGGTAQSTFSEMTSLVSIADKTGFIMIIPEATGENCWDAGSARSLKHGGGGDTGAIVQMVKYSLTKYGADAARVYSVGGSSGGIMTEALLGVYPDVFVAGISLMGVPCGCWAEGYNDVTGSGSTAQWSGSCAGGTVTKSAQAWGDLVRSYSPGYTGPWPRLQHWHGTADTTINYKNLAEDVKEWTNLLGLSETPTSTDMPASGTTHQSWKNECGYVVYETFALSGVGHAVPFDGKAVAAYFGLDTQTASDPQAVACGAGAGGSSGAGGGGMGGRAGGSGGATNGGRGGMGAAGASTGGMIGVAGTSGVGGSSVLGGAGTGGANAGTSGSSSSGSGGSVMATGGAAGAGAGGSSGSSNRAGAGGDAGTTNAGRAGAAAGSGAGAATSSGVANDSQGCACSTTAAAGSRNGALALILAGLWGARRRGARARQARSR
jgi:acetylxylan esterase